MAEVKTENNTLVHAERKCPECDGNRFIRDYETSEIVCITCGFVIEEGLTDRGPEWRAFDGDQIEKRTRVGAPLTYTIHDKGLSTVIDWRNKDTYGKNLPPGRQAQVYRLRKWQSRSRVSNAAERNLAFALSELSKINSALNLPKNILETASILYRRAIRRNLIRGRSIRGVTAAAVYMACRQCGVARTLDEVSQSAMMERKEVGRSYRFMVKELDVVVPHCGPSQYVSRFLNQLGLVGPAETLAMKILSVAKQTGLTAGRGPLGMAAASAYIASSLVNERRTQRKIAEQVNVTEVTIRNRYKELMEILEISIKL